MDEERLYRPIHPVTVAGEVASRLREMIRTGEFRPGDRIPSERALAERLGVGRPAVREALGDLKAHGLLIAGRGSQGTVVAGVPTGTLLSGLDEAAGQGAEHLADLMELRTAVEVQAAGLAARRSNREDRRRLTATLAPHHGPLSPHADRSFHEALAQACRNPLLRELSASLTELLHDKMPALLGDLYAQPAAAETLRRQHEALADAIEQGDEQAARMAMRRHLAYATQGLAQLAGSGEVIHMAVLDLDGTLLAGPRELSRRNIEVVRRVRDTGVEVVLASARLPRNMAPYHEELGLSSPVIACNGALLWDLADGVPLARMPLDLGLAQEVVDLSRELGAIPNVHSDNDWLTDRVDERILAAIQRVGVLPPQEVGTQAVDRVLASGGPADKLSVDLRDLGPRTASVRDTIRSALARRASLTESVEGLIDIVSLEASKAAMARRVARSLDVAPDQVLAIGDHDNDIPLVEWAGLGVAMGNATPALKAVADAVTSSNLRDGVAEALERWVLTSQGI